MSMFHEFVTYILGKDIHGLPVDGSDKQESNTSKARVTSAGTDKEQAEPEAEPAAGGGWDDDTEGWDDDQWGDMEVGETHSTM